MTTLTCRDVTLTRPTPDGQPRTILDGVTATFASGSFHLIVGAIGSGKTTLLHLLATLLRPTSGVVLADDQPVSRFTAAHRDRWRRGVGLAFQAALLLPELTALENVMLPLIPRAPSLSQARQHALNQLERLQITHLAARRPPGLSGGERQRVTLARALVHAPALILADEPTAHQDPDGAALVLRLLTEEQARGATLIVVSHDLAVLQSDAPDVTWRLAEGALTREGGP